MTLEEFLEKLRGLDVTVYERVDDKKKTYSNPYYRIKNRKKDSFTGEDFLFNEWRTGGVSGGSCWDEGESRHYPVSGEPEPDFTDLDAVLEALCPNIPYLQYKKLLPLIKSDERTEYEYYGNSTTYGFKVLKLSDLYNELVKLKLI